jgi:hypothetical protein
MKTVLAALILLGSAAAQANPGQGLAHDQVFWRHAPASTERGDNDRGDRRTADPAATSAPEMDPGSAIAAFALLLGGLAVVGGNRSSGKKPA